MARSLILLSLLIVGYSIQVKINGCTCEEVLQQTECDEYHPNSDLVCDWNEQKNVCESYPKTECSLILGSELCRAQTSCGWVSGKCVKFTQCSDYKETVDQKCNNINHTCVVDKDDKCTKEKPLECESFAPEQCKSTSESRCVLSGDPAKCGTMTTCEKGSYNSAQCFKNPLSCFWENDKCRNKKCSDILSKDSCLFVFSFDWQMATLCHWTTEGKCVDGEEDHYTAENCFTHSAQGKVWKDGKCRACSDSPGYSKILSMTMILVAIIMI